jgi:hypothetical protein
MPSSEEEGKDREISSLDNAAPHAVRLKNDKVRNSAFEMGLENSRICIFRFDVWERIEGSRRSQCDVAKIRFRGGKARSPGRSSPRSQ